MRKETDNFRDSAIMEGMTSIRAVLSSCSASDCRIVEILYDKAKKAKKEKELRYLAHRAEEYGFPMTETDAATLDKLCTGNTHGGIVALTLPRPIPVLTAEMSLAGRGFYVMIEGIEDPYNFGYAIRSLYACGVNGIILPSRNWMSAAGVVARASAGASELIDMYTVPNGETAADIFHAKGYAVVCAAEDTDLCLQKAKIPCPVFLVIGGERRGISAALRQKCDFAVKIDYGRAFGASLSAASAATVFAYEITRQNLF